VSETEEQSNVIGAHRILSLTPWRLIESNWDILRRKRSRHI